MKAKKTVKASRVDILIKGRARNGKYYFTRHAPNGEKLERSQMYVTRSGRNKAVNRIAKRERVIIQLAK